MLEKILEYQELEFKKRNLEKELEDSDDRKNASKIQKSLKEQHSELVNLEESAKKINELYENTASKYAEYMEKLSKLEEEIKNADPEKSELYEKIYSDFLKVGDSLEKNITEINKKIQKISDDYEKIIKKSKTDRAKFDKYKEAYTALKNKNDPEIKKLGEEMAKIEGDINEKIFSAYKQKRENNIFKVFVPLSENGNCGGCRMEISKSKIDQINASELGIIECETCGRYIYQK